MIDSIENISIILVPILKKYSIKYAGVFGSYARGEARPDSDVDILVNFKNPISLFDHAGIELDLENKIGKKVDLVTERSLSKYIRPFIMKELFTLYEGR